MTVLGKYVQTKAGTECGVPGTRMAEERQTWYLIPRGPKASRDDGNSQHTH